MFESPSVKVLLQQASQLGSFHGMAFMGDLSEYDFNDVLQDAGTRNRLKFAFQTAAGEIGSAKAMAKAVKAARGAAEAYLYVRKVGGAQKSALEDKAGLAVRTLIEQ
jgi:hypothetical protein